jgi:hypothetical protein
VDIVQAEGWAKVSFDQLILSRVNAVIYYINSGGVVSIEQRYVAAGVWPTRGILRGGDGRLLSIFEMRNLVNALM